MTDFLTIDYAVHVQNQGLVNLVNRISFGVKAAMQRLVDAVVLNIKGQFTDAQLAQTVIGFVEAGGIRGSDDFAITGHITSTWPSMIFYEEGRKPGGKMPPIDALVAWANRNGITPDPEKAKISFAFAINSKRAVNGFHRLPIDVLVKWMDDKGVTPDPEKGMRSMAFAMGKKIVKEGIAGHHYFAIGLAQSAAQIQQSFENLVIDATGVSV